MQKKRILFIDRMIERDSKAKTRKQEILDVIQMVFCFVYFILPFALSRELERFTLKAVSNLRSIHTRLHSPISAI